MVTFNAWGSISIKENVLILQLLLIIMSLSKWAKADFQCDVKQKVRNHYHSRFTSAFSHLEWGWMGDDCPPHLSILHHMLLHSQQVPVLPQTITPNSHLTQYNPSVLFTCPNHLSLLCLNLTERSSTPHISTTSLLDLPSCLLTSSMYLSILPSHLHRHPSVCLSIHVFLLHKVKQISNKFHIPFS